MLTRIEVGELAVITGPCLSVFEPLRDDTEQISVAETRLNGVLRQVEAMLAEKGYPSEVRQHFLQPIQDLARHTDWSGRSGSIAIFRAPGFTKSGFCHGKLGPDMRLADEFFVLPLLPGIEDRGFSLLALSTKRIRLFRGNSRGMDEMPLPNDLPRNLAEAGGFDKPDHDLEGRSAPGMSNGQGSAIRFGTSSDRDVKWEHVRDFFRMIDRAIQPILAQSGDPLMLAAVEREQAIYREVNTWSNLFEEGICGSPDGQGDNWLEEQALKVLSASAGETAANSVRDMEAAAGARRLVTEPTEIIEAAGLGQVDRLFIAQKPDADEMLVNSAALAVLRNSGTVSCGEFPNVPRGIAAILRYRTRHAGEALETAGSRAR